MVGITPRIGFRPRGIILPSGRAISLRAPRYIRGVTQTAAGVTSATTPSLTVDGVNRLLVVWVVGYLGTINATSVTFNGTALKRLGGDLWYDATGTMECYYMVTPPVVSATVVATYASAVNIRVVAELFNNADQNVPMGALLTQYTPNAAPTASTALVPVGSDGDLLIDALGYFPTDGFSPDPTQTQLDTVTDTIRTSYRRWSPGAGMSWKIAAGTAHTQLAVAIHGDQNIQQITEAMALADTPSAAMITPQSVSEAMALADTPSSTATFAPSVSEAMALADTPSASAIFAVSVAESMSLADTEDASVVSGGGNTYNVSVSEAMSLAETASAVAIFAASASEAMALADTPSASAIFAVSVAESMSLADTPSAKATFAVTVAEAMALAEASSTQVNFLASVSEAMALLDSAVIQTAAKGTKFSGVFTQQNYRTGQITQVNARTGTVVQKNATTGTKT